MLPWIYHSFKNLTGLLYTIKTKSIFYKVVLYKYINSQSKLVFKITKYAILASILNKYYHVKKLYFNSYIKVYKNKIMEQQS